MRTHAYVYEPTKWMASRVGTWLGTILVHGPGRYDHHRPVAPRRHLSSSLIDSTAASLSTIVIVCVTESDTPQVHTERMSSGQ